MCYLPLDQTLAQRTAETAEDDKMLDGAVLARMVVCDGQHSIGVTLAGDVYWTGYLPARHLRERKKCGGLQRPNISKAVKLRMANLFTRVQPHTSSTREL
jgi:hypothetical protein